MILVKFYALLYINIYIFLFVILYFLCNIVLIAGLAEFALACLESKNIDMNYNSFGVCEVSECGIIKKGKAHNCIQLIFTSTSSQTQAKTTQHYVFLSETMFHIRVLLIVYKFIINIQ